MIILADGKEVAYVSDGSYIEIMASLKWSAFDAEPMEYVCGFCNNHTGSSSGFRAFIGGKRYRWLYICQYCFAPTYFVEGMQYPSSRFGSPVENLPTDINALYGESRDCFSVNAFTAAVMCCRKILMHVAVENKAKDGLKFIEYVQYLLDNHIVPPSSQKWVDKIRQIGNDANHEIKIMSEDDAKTCILFVEMLLKLVYDYPTIADNMTP